MTVDYRISFERADKVVAYDHVRKETAVYFNWQRWTRSTRRDEQVRIEPPPTLREACSDFDAAARQLGVRLEW